MIGRTNVGGGAGGAGGGATLVISSPANVSVTVSKDDKSYTKNSGSLGSTTFKGLATGTWTVTISGNGQTATRTIEITADYAITIAFFSATINITYPANSNCVVTNSGGQTVASDTNSTSSEKTFTATVNATGTYTVTATATDGSGNIKSESVEITSEGQSVNVALLYRYEYYMHGVEKIPLEAILDREGNYGSVTENATSVRIDSGGYNVAVGYISSNSVDLSKVHTLYCKITNITGQTSRSDIGLRLSVCDTKIGYKNKAGRTDTAVVDIPANTLTDDVCSLDVSFLDGGYIGVYSYGAWASNTTNGIAFDMVEFYAM